MKFFDKEKEKIRNKIIPNLMILKACQHFNQIRSYRRECLLNNIVIGQKEGRPQLDFSLLTSLEPKTQFTYEQIKPSGYIFEDSFLK